RARPEGWLRRQARRARRHPVWIGAMLLAILLTTTVGAFAWAENRRLVRDAETALDEGQQRLEHREYAEALRTLSRGLERSDQAHGSDALASALKVQLARARRGLASRELHDLAERARYLFDPDALPPGQRITLEGHCRKVWDARDR